MKKIINITLALLALVTFSAACSKETPADQTPAAKAMTIKATITDAATRVTFDPTYDASEKPASMGHLWETGDKLRITDASDASKTALFDLVDGAGTVTGTFEGTGFEAASYNVEAVPQGSFSNGFTQTQEVDGSTGHLQFVATATGVTDLSSFALTETSGIIGIIAKLPVDVTGTIEAVEIEAAGLAITINLETQDDTEFDDILKVYANLPTGFALPAGTEVCLKFHSTNADHPVYTRCQKFTSALVPQAGKFNYVRFNCSRIDKSAGGSGTEADPYLIADKYQMDAIRDLLVPGQTTCFKMVADVDMTGITWVSLNNGEEDGQYNRYIAFDGDNHTLSNITTDEEDIHAYPSVFGVMNGSVANLNIDKATITPGSKKAGVLAGYIGSGDSAVVPSVTNVHITNSTVGADENRPTNYVGGVAGQINIDGTILSNVSIESSTVYGNPSENKTIGGMIAYIKCGATLEKCHSAAQVNARAYVGGLVGFTEAPAEKTITISQCYYDGPGVTATYRYAGGIVGHNNDAGTLLIKDCYSTGNVTASKGWAGGISGDHYKGAAQIYNCFATGAVTASFGAGGLVGQVNADNLDIQKCAAFVPSVTATSTDEDMHYSSGAVIAYTKGKVLTAKDCYYQSGLTLTECPGNVGNTLPASDPDWVENGTISEGAHQYIYPFHGRSTTQSLTRLASTTLGWSSSVWDFSGDIPKLK